MLNKIKTYAALILVIITILSLSYGLYSSWYANKMQAERDNAMDELKVKTAESITYQNELGQTVTRVIEYEKSVKDLKNSNDSLEKEIYKIYKASKIEKKQLEEAFLVKMNSSNSGKYKEIIIKDTINICPQSIKIFDDRFLTAKIYEDSLSYSYDDTIILLKGSRKVDRKFFLWKWIGWEKTIDKDMVEITSRNPNSKLNGRMIKIN